MTTLHPTSPFPDRAGKVSLGARRVIPTRSSVGSRFSKRTLVGTLGNARDAPIPVVAPTTIEPRGLRP
jgi:hypothetical protein